MPRSLLHFVVTFPLAFAFVPGCGGSSDFSVHPAIDGASDGALDDAGRIVVTTPGDSSASDVNVGDSSPSDANTPDAKVGDSTVSDANAGDSSPSDTRIGDTAGTETESSDVGMPDAGAIETSPEDTSVPDVGAEASVPDAPVGPDAVVESAVDALAPDAILPTGPAPVALGLAGGYVILAESAITTIPASMITGDVGVSPAAATSITGFSMTLDGTYWTSTQVVGNIFAADNDIPTPGLLTTAISNMDAAYTDAASRPSPDFTDLGAGAIGGLTLVPGLYEWSSAVAITTDVTFTGGENDTWILQVTGGLTEAASIHVKLTGGARPRNIVWQVAGAVTMGAGAHLEGTLLCQTAIALGAGASVNGRLLSQTAVTLAMNTVTAPTL